MGQPEVAISKHIVRRLGESGVAETMSSLFLVDCQTCNGPLAGTTVALVVTDMMVFARAELHHRRCRKSEWIDAGIVRGGGGATLSHQMRTPLLPWQNRGSGEVVVQPVFLLNPGLESVLLEHDDDGQWHVKTPAQFTAAGLAPATGGIRELPVEAVVRLAADGVAITMDSPPAQTYLCAADTAYREQVRARGGVMLIVTHALNPQLNLRNEQLLDALEDPRTVAGWVALAELRDKQPPRSNPVAAAITYVLHQSPKQLAVGPLLGHNPAPLSAEQAQQWAQEVIGCETLIGWDPAINGEPASGWFTMDFLSAAQYLLRQYPDGWRVVRALSHVDGAGGAETENEARAWANGVVQFQDKVTGLQWAPGPTPEGASTLYATAE